MEMCKSLVELCWNSNKLNVVIQFLVTLDSGLELEALYADDSDDDDVSL